MITDPQTPLKDMKEGLSSSRKPDITHVRLGFMVYTSRPCSYGSVKYERANYARPVALGHYVDAPGAADFERLRAYVRAGISHLVQVLDAMELHQSTDPKLQDVDGMKRAAYAVDTDEDTTGKVGPSFLPHIGPACASLNMAVQQAILCGLLPKDPGEPWADKQCVSPYAQEAKDAWIAAGGPATLKNATSQFVASMKVELTTDAGSKLMSYQLTAEGERALTVDTPKATP